MKAKICKKKEKEEKKFKSFSIKIKIESIEEARLMYHLSSCSNIDDLIKRSIYWNRTYNDNFNKKLSNCYVLNEDKDLWEMIKEEIDKQGYKI